MSKFTAFYNLCPIHDTKEFIGISPDREDGNVITTLGRNMIFVIKISTQKQIRCWSVLEKLSSKVVFDHKSQQYVGVFANCYLRSWDESITDINKCKKLKFHKNIAELVSDGHNTLVLYADGSCESLASAVESRKINKSCETSPFNLAANITFAQAKISTLVDGRKFLTYFQTHSDNTVSFTKVSLTSSPELKSDGDQIKFNLRRGNQNVTIAGYAVIDGDNFPMLLTIWSDKRLFLLNLSGQLSSNSSPGNFASMINSLKVEHPVSILGISKHYIAIYGANSPHEGASLMLYNTQFKVIKAKQYFKIYFNDSRLWSINSYILIAMGQNLSVVHYTMTKDLLSELVGSQISHNFQNVVEGDYINEEYSLEECLQYSSIKISPKTNNLPQKMTKSPLIWADGKIVPFESASLLEKEIQFMTKLNMHVDISETNDTSEPYSIKLMSNYNDNGFSNREIDLISRQLEICGASEHEITEKILPVLMTSDLVKDIANCLRRYKNISPKMLAKTMNYALNVQNYCHTFSDLNNADSMDVDMNLETPNNDFNLLNVVLSCSFDVNSIAMHIRKEIDYKYVLVLLEYLHNLVICPAEFLEERPELEDIDFELQIFRWFGVFLNAHFQKLALSNDLQLLQILRKWSELFILYKKKFGEMEKLSALLYNIIQKKNIVKEKHYFKWYSIEEVQLY